MAVKKSELYSSLWASCDSLRGGMDSSQYKNYILTLLFVKYVSDKYKIDDTETIIAAAQAELDEMIENADEDSVINDVLKDSGNLDKAALKKALKDEALEDDDRKVLQSLDVS